MLRRCLHYRHRLPSCTMLYLIGFDRLYWPRPSLATNCYAAIPSLYTARFPPPVASNTSCEPVDTDMPIMTGRHRELPAGSCARDNDAVRPSAHDSCRGRLWPLRLATAMAHSDFYAFTDRSPPVPPPRVIPP
ncbi:uncharacterized protein LOC108153603 isoform X2 [Drosophila miranda]|uniref:uncharacterized protein LOC108153603 isoform X2 n=1 Tax=Drosophila miranda TaxID=7229 RepID=UPI0007E79FA9|nr:uncharacterized protein LOC108153603 isoform X2 [Drosophila miranda]